MDTKLSEWKELIKDPSKNGKKRNPLLCQWISGFFPQRVGFN
jgi:hypothetical protein